MAISSYDNGFPNGVLIRGIPLIDLQSSSDAQTFWVDSRAYASGDANKGTFVRPFKTLQAAIDKCRNYVGDKIFVASGHAETVDYDIDVHVAGVQIIGLGNKDNRPFFNFHNGNYKFSVTANNVYIGNMRFRGFTLYNSPIVVDALLHIIGKRGYYENMLFETTNDLTGALNFVRVPINKSPSNNADDTTFSNCDFMERSGTLVFVPKMYAGINIGGPINGLKLHNCNVIGKFEKGCIFHDYAMIDTPSEDMSITGNGIYFNELKDPLYKAMDLKGIISGYMSDGIRMGTYTIDQQDIILGGRTNRGKNGEIEYAIFDLPYADISTFGTVLMDSVVGAYAIENIILETGPTGPINNGATLSVEKDNELTDRGDHVFFSFSTTYFLDTTNATLDMTFSDEFLHTTFGTITTGSRLIIKTSDSLAAISGSMRITIKLRKIKDSTFYATTP
jgi:hypothetical protein